MRVSDIMTSPVITVSSEATLVEAIDLLIGYKLSGLPVVDPSNKLCGILSEGDLLRRLELGTERKQKGWRAVFSSSPNSAEDYRLSHGRNVADVMSASPVTIAETAPLGDAVDLMEKHRCKRLPVMREGELVGMVSRADFVKALRTYVTHAYEVEVVSDTEIKERIVAALRQERWASDYGIEVAVENGRVTLSGSVTTDDQRRAVRVATDNVNGVRSVHERLTVFEPVLIPGV